MTKKVLSLGQCAADNYAISRLLESSFAVEVVAAETARAALDRLRQESFDLVLVNRIFDADGSSGLSFISHIKKDPSLHNAPVMLVSNHADAQKRAEALAALPGFGKAALRDASTLERLRPVLGEAPDIAKEPRTK